MSHSPSDSPSVSPSVSPSDSPLCLPPLTPLDLDGCSNCDSVLSSLELEQRETARLQKENKALVNGIFQLQTEVLLFLLLLLLLLLLFWCSH